MNDVDVYILLQLLLEYKRHLDGADFDDTEPDRLQVAQLLVPSEGLSPRPCLKQVEEGCVSLPYMCCILQENTEPDTSLRCHLARDVYLCFSVHCLYRLQTESSLQCRNPDCVLCTECQYV